VDEIHAAAAGSAEELFPHARLGGEVRGLGSMTALDADHVLSPNAAPAGGISASAADMSRWIALQLAAA